MPRGLYPFVATSFAVTWDYRCPFARNAHEHLITALESGASWDVRFLAFSLDQTHVDEGNPPVWDEPDRYPALLANAAGIVVRDRLPDHFLRVHRALFSARHDQLRDLRSRPELAAVLTAEGLDAGAILDEVDDGWPLEVFRQEHTDASEKLDVFGVPTFIYGGRAAFVRLLDRPQGDPGRALVTVERIVTTLVDWPELNEFKYTQLSK